MSGLLEALTGAVGEALGEIRGHLLTRLTAPARPIEQVSRGSATLSSGDGVNLTLSTGIFGAGVVAGTRLRLLSGASAGASALVVSVGGGGTTAVVGAGLPASFAGLSWEVERLADTTIAVESTLYWSATGEFFLGAVRYRYTGTTPTSLTGLTHYDGEAWLPGVAQRQEPLDVVADYTRNRTALDRLRRSFFVETALGEELNDLGANHGRPRLEALADDDTYRAWLRATMYAPWGTRLAVFQILDALLGAGAWESFEDFTGSDDFARIYLRLTGEDVEDPAGQAWLGGDVFRLPSSSTTIVVPEPPIRVGSVVLAPDSSARVVASGSGALTTNGTTITGAPGTFPARIRRGDAFEVLDGPRAGERGLIATNVSTSQLTLGSVTGHSGGGLSGASPAFRWRVVRQVTDCRFVRPSSDTALEYDGDPGTAAWSWQGTVAEGTGALLVTDAVSGDRTAWGSPTAGLTGWYRRQARIQPESIGELEIVGAAATSSVLSPTDGLQWTVQIRDGARAIAIGFFYVDGLVDGIGFLNATTGAVIGAVISLPITVNFRSIVLRKRGRDTVQLMADGVPLASLAYASFAAATETELRVGCVSTTNPAFANVREMSWRIETSTDYWAARAAAGTVTASPARNVGGLGGIVLVGDVGRDLEVSGAVARNPGGGTANGVWSIEARVDANTATVVGPTRAGATFRLAHPTRIFLPPEYALTFPDALGHQLQILDGDDAGTYGIAALLDSSFTDLAGLVPDSVGQALGNIRERALVVEVTGAPVGGFTATDGSYAWRIVPVFAADTGLAVQIADAGTVATSTLTLRQALPITTPLPVVAVTYTVVNSAHTEAETDVAGTRWPFFLFDGWGALRPLLLEIAAAGVEVNLDDLQRDAAGLHIVTD